MIKVFTVALIAAAIMTAACPADEYCSKCVGAKCLVCVNAYLVNDICTPVTTAIANCRSYSSATLCSSCAPGYRLLANVCSEITIADCDYVDDKITVATCIGCGNGKIVSANACKDGASCSADNCSICDSLGLCQMCKSNFSISATNTCVKDPIPNCAAAFTAGVCAVCEFGYYDMVTECKKTDLQNSSSIISAFAALMVMMKLIA